MLQVSIIRRTEYRCYVNGKSVGGCYTELDAIAWLSSMLYKKESKIAKASCVTEVMVKRYRNALLHGSTHQQLLDSEFDPSAVLSVDIDMNPSNWLRPPK